jgi:hypothetical protein
MNIKILGIYNLVPNLSNFDNRCSNDVCSASRIFPIVLRICPKIVLVLRLQNYHDFGVINFMLQGDNMLLEHG